MKRREFTGFSDILHTPIFEGDIVKPINEDIVFEVCKWDGIDDWMADCGSASGNFFLKEIMPVEIIGSIHLKRSNGYKLLKKQIEQP